MRRLVCAFIINMQQSDFLAAIQTHLYGTYVLKQGIIVLIDWVEFYQTSQKLFWVSSFSKLIKEIPTWLKMLSGTYYYIINPNEGKPLIQA